MSRSADPDLELASREEDSDGEAGPGVGLRVGVPTSMKMLDDDGNVVTVPLHTGGDVKVCCGCPRPPGGWYGPFGFFRLASFFFLLLSVAGMVLAIMALIHGDAVGVVGCLVLVVAAGLSSLASYAHEGMAREISVMGRLNEEYAAKNERLSAQVASLQGVEQQLEGIQSSMGMGLDELMGTIDAMHRLTSTQQLTTILQAFTDADRYGTADRVLRDREVEVFFNSARGLLEDAAPGFDLTALQAAIAQNGMGIDQVRFLINAVVAGGDETPGRAEAELWLLMYTLSPSKGNLDKCADALKRVIPGKTPEQLKAALEAADPDEEEEESHKPSAELLALSRSVMHGTA